MEPLANSLRQFILDPKHADLLGIVKGIRNGAVYGTYIRFPHALVSGSFRDKLFQVIRATYTHARNLGVYVGFYKTAMYLLKQLNGGKVGYYDPFWAGMFGGYAVFGRGKPSAVSQQICIYVFARVVLGLAKLSVQKGFVPTFNGKTQEVSWPVFAALSWAFVMLLFKHHPDTLQPSLQSSMTYLYINSERWNSLRNFFLVDK